MTGKFPSHISRWASDQLAGVFPDWLKAMFFGMPLAAEVRFSKDMEVISDKNSHLIVPQSLLQAGGPSIVPVRRKIVDAFIPQNFFLQRRIEAPSTAVKNLWKLAELDMVRKTPFRVDDVYWAISKPNRSNGSLKVEQWIARRSDIEQLLVRAAEVGLHIRKIFVEGDPMPQPIADFSSSITPGARRWRFLNGALAIGALGLSAMIWLYPAWQASVESARISENMVQNRTRALALRQEVEDLRSREMERAAFLDFVFQRPRLSDTLREITVALPDTTWLGDMNFSSERIIVSGEVTGSAAQLVLTLAQLSEFQNPRLSGPVARANNDAERFELTLDLVSPK